MAKALPRRGGDLNDTGLDRRTLKLALKYALIPCALLYYNSPLSLFSTGQLWMLGQ